jgi:pimeloyl-ACP methyl ester carboxylesterase
MISISSIVLLGLVLAACGSAKQAPITVPADAQAGDLVGLESCTYEAHDIKYDADCGVLVVPENWDDPNSRLIALPVVRVRALSDSPAEPIFYFAGGPGHSNLHFGNLAGLVENHDLVQVGYRGVDGTVVLDCPEVDQAMKGVDDDVLSEASLAGIGDAHTRCRARLEAAGVDLAGYTVVQVVQDAEAARVALGYNGINLLGQSFGTRLEMLYTWMYPDSLGRVIMIAVNPPGHMVWGPDDMDRLIALDAALCERDTECSTRADDLAKTMRNITNNMPEQWLFFSIAPSKVVVATQFMLFHRGSAASAYDAYLAAEEGDPSGLALFSLMYNFMLPTANTWGFTFAMAVPADYDPSRDYLAEMVPPGSTFGAPMSQLSWGPVQFMDQPLLIPEEYRQVQPSDVQTLLVSGNMDYSTPIWQATEELLPTLSNGEQVILSEFGHSGDVWSLQPEATEHLLTTFFDTGEVDDSLYTYRPMDFSVGFLGSYPKLAKTMLAVVVLVPLGLVALVWFVVRWLRRRRASQSA